MPNPIARSSRQRQRRMLKRIARQLLLLPPLVFATIHLQGSHQLSTLELIKERGYIRMITTLGPITYYENAKGGTGFEYLLAKRFADYLEVDLKVSVRDTLGEVQVALGGPNGDFAAAGLTITPKRQQQAHFATPYTTVTQQMLYKLGTGRPKTIEQLDSAGRLLVIKNSAHVERMNELKLTYPNLTWEEYPAADMLELMELVHTGATNYAVVDSLAYLVNRSIYPKARTAFTISDEQPVAWAFPNYGDRSLLNAANEFLEQQDSSGKLERLKAQFFGHVDEFSVAGSQLFMRRVDKRLPKYEPMFREVAEQFDVDWHLLAAIAYQESHWNARAKSPTGVRGLMMLTLPTSREMGIKNRLDPEQSLWAGAQYYLKTKKKIPKRITEPDRTWMALASYNVGFGHLEDARVLTERGGKNPDLWDDVKQFLPLLEQKKYYSTVRRRFARGREAVSYVQNIRHYQDILQWRTLEMERQEQRKRERELEEEQEHWGEPFNI